MIFTNKNGGIKIKEVLLCMIGIHGDVPWDYGCYRPMGYQWG